MIDWPIESVTSAIEAFYASWPTIVDECRAVLAGELHYQAVTYYSLRVNGVPIGQVGMNVKQYIAHPVTSLFQQYDRRRNFDYQGGFEPIPDIVIFSSAIGGDWRRRRREETLKHMLLAVELKASERHKGRLRYGEIAKDIEKLAAHREEVLHRGGNMAPVMMLVDTAKDRNERMAERELDRAEKLAEERSVLFFYLSSVRVSATPRQNRKEREQLVALDVSEPQGQPFCAPDK